MSRLVFFAAFAAGCTQSPPSSDAALAELADQLEETNARLAEISTRLEGIESRLEDRDAAMQARMERMREARRDMPSPSSRASKIDPKKLDEGIACADGVCKLQRSLLEEILANPANLAATARVIPAMEDGVQRGFKLYGMRPGTLPVRLGFQNGDQLLTINDFPLDSPDKALEAYATLRAAKRLTVAIERRGKPHEITIEIQ